MEFRDLTLARLQAFSGRGFFSVADYIRDPLRFQAALEVTLCRCCCCLRSRLEEDGMQRRLAPLNRQQSVWIRAQRCACSC